jgi:thymidylate synthase (FAD)
VIKFRSDMVVELIQHVGSDEMIARAARVSTKKDQVAQEGVPGLINYLMRDRHGSPFEHNSMTFRIEAPIFVWREFHRHRIGFSYNEMSSRYTQLPAEFYEPDAERNLVQEGKPGAYTYRPGTPDQFVELINGLRSSYEMAYFQYEHALENEIAREVARLCLPVAIYSVCYVTCNARSLMSFLSLRTKREYATFPSFPQREIEMVAEKMESEFETLFPHTWAAFCKAGRVAP